MADLREVQSVIDRGGHRAVVSAVRADGAVHSSVVAAGLTRHPVTGEPAAAFTSAAGAVKLRLLRERPQAALVFQEGPHWASVAGHTDLIGYDDPYEGVDPAHLRALLRGVFSAAGGEHEDWEAYERAMEEERRTAVLIAPERVFAM